MIANKLKIAITGGIGSGKSTVSSIIKELGYPVYSADEIYSELLRDQTIVKKCSDILGIKPLNLDGKLVFDRTAASKIVFDNIKLRQKLNEYTHALVYEKMDSVFAAAAGDKIFFEIPLLFESGKEGDFDRVLIVVRDLGDRISSVVERDNVTKEKVEKIISSQYNYDILPEIKHTLIKNDDITRLYQRVKETVENL